LITAERDRHAQQFRAALLARCQAVLMPLGARSIRLSPSGRACGEGSAACRRGVRPHHRRGSFEAVAPARRPARLEALGVPVWNEATASARRQVDDDVSPLTRRAAGSSDLGRGGIEAAARRRGRLPRAAVKPLFGAQAAG
jgi:hypothetical protein